MSAGLPIWIREPGSRDRRDLLASKLSRGKREVAIIPEPASTDELKRQLKQIREYTRDNMSSLAEELKANLHQKYPQAKVKSASDAAEAIAYISDISDGTNTISTNNSSVVCRELKPGLITRGFTVINSYLKEFDVKERNVLDYWSLASLLDSNLTGAFDISTKMTGLNQPGVADAESRKYLAVLGVTAIAAEDGTVFFLQHFSNIGNDLKQAEKVILVVGLDKIVKGRQDAALVSECMGIFGMESTLLGIQPETDKTPSITELPLPPGESNRTLHIIILDNGRTDLLKTEYKDLILCIGCRACNRHCPIRHSFTDADYLWTPKSYLNDLLDGNINSTDVCLHCESCRADCPLDIDLPGLMWQAKTDNISKQGISFYHKILGRPETLAKLGSTFASLSNFMMGNRLIRIPMEIIAGIDRKANLPIFRSRTFRKWFKNNG